MPLAHQSKQPTIEMISMMVMVHFDFTIIIIIGARVNFQNNRAKLGGGLSLEANAKLYILKYYV